MMIYRREEKACIRKEFQISATVYPINLENMNMYFVIDVPRKIYTQNKETHILFPTIQGQLDFKGSVLCDANPHSASPSRSQRCQHNVEGINQTVCERIMMDWV